MESVLTRFKTNDHQLPWHAIKLNKLTLHICSLLLQDCCQTAEITPNCKCNIHLYDKHWSDRLNLFCSGADVDGYVWGRVEAGMHWVVENPVKVAAMVGLTAVGAMVFMRRRRFF